ncbi:MAG: pyridoxamine 5'-phosphate oxidase family protein [Chloroflexi bacterium]|nr:pyridoxamine 5'-phosphate oxidase family protein [Chloroflexota bacterium]
MSLDNLKKAIGGTKERRKKPATLTKQEVMAQSLELVENSFICMLGTNGGAGFPNIKALLNLKHEGLKKIWFSTNTSSKRVQQLKKDNKACVYYVNEKRFKGLMLLGTVEILQDNESKKMLWAEGAEVYYPQGIEDPDYSVLNFTAKQGNYYQGLQNVDFEIE